MKNPDIVRSIPNKIDDALLINSLQNGEEGGLEGIYRLYSKQLLFFAQKYIKNYQIAEEIVADVFVKLWERRVSFSSLDRIRAFLYIVTKNKCLNQLRGTNRCESIDDVDNYEELLYEDLDAFAKIVRAELLKMIYNEVQKLPEKQREVFNKTFLEDKTIEEISKEMNMAPQAVYTNKSRALTALRQSPRLKDALLLLALISAV
ncbi:MAG TPA: sigma-70 family RNA polymerase sigma factor [Sphingobacterium sp.]|jgi:RNA polymerase sigma-70 factor (family 1)|nr:sigma-70 family RNA polymerase sigma factor [Sphingobacterium sp.]